MEGIDEEQVVVPKPAVKKSTSTAKLRQTSRSKLNSVEEVDSAAASISVPVAASFTAPIASAHVATTATAAVTASKLETTTATSLKPSTSKSKLTKLKKQSTLESEEPPAVRAACEANQNSCIVLDDDSMAVEPAAVVKPSSKSSKVAPSSSRASATATASAKADPHPTAAAIGIKKKSTMNRLTDLITKSPIIEQLRRPQRQSKLKSSASNVSDCTNLSTVSGASNTSTMPKSKTSLAKKMDDEESTENMDPKDDAKLRKAPSRKKKAV